MSKLARAEVNRTLAHDSDMAFVFKKIDKLGQARAEARKPSKIDDRPAPEPIRVDPIPEPSYVQPDPKAIEQVDKILAEIIRMCPLLSERDRLELQGICQMKVYLNSKK